MVLKSIAEFLRTNQNNSDRQHIFANIKLNFELSTFLSHIFLHKSLKITHFALFVPFITTFYRIPPPLFTKILNRR